MSIVRSTNELPCFLLAFNNLTELPPNVFMFGLVRN
uniref:Uncharacterized protein n=1 Tax=Anguilla anguilla TaxID=7936 RepID=A0A0E9X9X7_ANGAN